MATTGSSRLFSNDLQASAPEVRIGLSRAGVTGVDKAIRLRRGRAREAHLRADRLLRRPRPARRRACTCPASRSSSRRRSTSVVIGEAFLVEELAEHIAARVVARQGALRAEVKIAARTRSARRTPVTGFRDAGDGLADRRSPPPRRAGPAASSASRRPGSTPARARRAMVRDRAAERLADAGFDDQDVERILDARPARDAQPARPGHALRRHARRTLNAETLSSWSRAR